jgi:hypothetical protein
MLDISPNTLRYHLRGDYSDARLKMAYAVWEEVTGRAEDKGGIAWA